MNIYYIIKNFYIIVLLMLNLLLKFIHIIDYKLKRINKHTELIKMIQN